MTIDARAEAQERIGERYAARVLEPSPPAITAAPWFAEDPVARADAPAGALARPVVSPVGTGDLRWEQLAEGDPELGAWCAERWLGPYRRLGPVPADLTATRLSWHRLAEQVVSPARRRATGKIGLRYTRGGFGTPFFGADVQVRVEGTELVVQRPHDEHRAPITTLSAAGLLLGPELAAPEGGLDDTPLELHPGAAACLADWYGFAASVLEELRAGAGTGADPSRVQLWPEHFDLAVELGAEAASARAAYGFSPGDDAHPEPYLYVAPWVAPEPSELWQATAFRGAELRYADLVGAEDQRASALAFLRARLHALPA